MLAVAEFLWKEKPAVARGAGRHTAPCDRWDDGVPDGANRGCRGDGRALVKKPWLTEELKERGRLHVRLNFLITKGLSNCLRMHLDLVVKMGLGNALHEGIYGLRREYIVDCTGGQILVKRLSVVDVDLCVGCQSCMFACNRRYGEAGLGRSAIHIQSAGGIERGFVVRVCRACLDPPCSKVCPTGALIKREGGGVRLNYAKCIACGNCVRGCTLGAIFWDVVLDKPTVCVYCGYCAGYCPYGVIRMEEVA